MRPHTLLKKTSSPPRFPDPVVKTPCSQHRYVSDPPIIHPICQARKTKPISFPLKLSVTFCIQSFIVCLLRSGTSFQPKCTSLGRIRHQMCPIFHLEAWHTNTHFVFTAFHPFTTRVDSQCHSSSYQNLFLPQRDTLRWTRPVWLFLWAASFLLATSPSASFNTCPALPWCTPSVCGTERGWKGSPANPPTHITTISRHLRQLVEKV